jgi:virulence-associated protein VagC
MPRTAKPFLNGRSQALRLPADLRFEGSEVFIRQDSTTGDVILSRRPESWDNFFQLRRQADVLMSSWQIARMKLRRSVNCFDRFSGSIPYVLSRQTLKMIE